MNYNNIHGIHKHSKPKVATQFGIYSFFKLTDSGNWFLQPEISYTGQGEGDQPFAPAGGQVKRRIFLVYLNIVTFLKWYPSARAK